MYLSSFQVKGNKINKKMNSRLQFCAGNKITSKSGKFFEFDNNNGSLKFKLLSSGEVPKHENRFEKMVT